MSIYHFPHRAIDGSWHAVYRQPGCDTLISIGDGLCEDSAQRMADDANREQVRKARAAAAEATPPAERPVRAGIYTTADAA